MSLQKVVVVQTTIRQYRVPLYQRLRAQLLERGVDLVVAHGEPDSIEQTKGDIATLEWAVSIPTRYVRVGSRSLVLQSPGRLLSDAALVIVEQASRHLLNYVLYAQNALGFRRLAFWGHGRNLQHYTASRLGEFVKRKMTSRVHWWFAYTEMSARIVSDVGYPSSRITVLNNAIDTHSLAEYRDALTEDDVRRMRDELGIRGDNLCVFLGSLYAEKLLSFLVDACDLINARVPDFNLVVIGGGPELPWLREAASRRPWLHAVGPQFGKRMACYAAGAKLVLMPGGVGLVILDAFTLRAPLVTTDGSVHGPEIEYLEPGVNGILVHGHENPATYANVVSDLLENEQSRAHLVKGCITAAERYTIDIMSDRFADGIAQALQAPRLGAQP